MRIPALLSVKVSFKKVIAKKPFLVRGCRLSTCSYGSFKAGVIRNYMQRKTQLTIMRHYTSNARKIGPINRPFRDLSSACWQSTLLVLSGQVPARGVEAVALERHLRTNSSAFVVASRIHEIIPFSLSTLEIIGNIASKSRAHIPPNCDFRAEVFGCADDRTD